MQLVLTIFEILATLTGIAAVGLQAKEKIVAWPIAIISVSLASVIYFYNRLYSDFGLHIIYIILNAYGWIVWTSKKTKSDVIKTTLLKKSSLAFFVLITIVGSVLLGYSMELFTDADLPYFDAFTTSGSLVAQYLLAKKYLQNWLFWIVVDLVAIPVYLYKELYFFSFLFLVYLIICVWGYFSWNKKLASS